VNSPQCTSSCSVSTFSAVNGTFHEKPHFSRTEHEKENQCEKNNTALKDTAEKEHSKSAGYESKKSRNFGYKIAVG